MTDDTNAEDSTQNVPSTPSVQDLSLDTVFEVLANRRRRFALYALTDATDGVLALDALLDEVVTLVTALDGVALTRDRYMEIATDLYQWHLPVLADVGLVDCDARHRTIRYFSTPPLETWLAKTAQDEFPGSSRELS